MPIGGILVGRDAHAYWNSNGDQLQNSGDHANWLGNAQTVEATNLMDLTDEIDSEMADATTRAEAREGFSSEIAVLKGGRVTFDIRWDPADAFTAALITAWDTGNGITMALLDQEKTVTGAQGLISIFSVSLQKMEELRNIQKASVSLSIAKYPKWYQVP